uniref:Ig-like domain-containing protein n=1 Tax=Sinocyclocheilus grahami TaxID=75366 RepID=A0A672PZZ7_SINGR
MQPTRVQTASEHEMVQLHCTYSTSDQYPSLYWYQHKTKGFPVYMLRKLSTGSNHRLTTKIRKKEKQNHVDLDISSAAVSDSALYYCALEPTVTGNTRTMYKNLTVKENNGILMIWRNLTIVPLMMGQDLVTIHALFPGHVLARISILPQISRFWLFSCSDYVQCLLVIGQTTFQSLPSASVKTGKQSQNLDILDNIEILARTETLCLMPSVTGNSSTLYNLHLSIK